MAEYGSNFFKTKQIELGDKMDLASYLLKPVQRMGKYALLLQQLMKASGERESSDLSSAEAMVRFQLRHGNDLLAMDSLRDCDVSACVTPSLVPVTPALTPLFFLLPPCRLI